MKKKMLLSAFALVAAFSLVGCGGTGDGEIGDGNLPEGMIVSTGDARVVIEDDDIDTVVIGVINPTAALVPFSAASRSIDGSYLIWRGDYSVPTSDLAISPNVADMRRSQAEMEELLSRANATPDTKIFVYSADAMHDAGRLVWQLKILGHENVWYIDGGINAWHDDGHPTGNSVRLADQPVRSNYTAPNYDPESFDVTLEQVVYAFHNPEDWIIIDTRGYAEYTGDNGLSGGFGRGRIADSVHIEWSRVLDPDTRVLLPQEEIEDIFLDVIDGRNVIVFCQSGVRSGHTWMVLTDVLGLDNVYNYEGSWIELSYAASSYSDFDGAHVLEILEQWSDNNGRF